MINSTHNFLLNNLTILLYIAFSKIYVEYTTFYRFFSNTKHGKEQTQTSKMRLYLLVFFSLLSFLAFSQVEQPIIALTQGSTSEFTIVLPDTPIPSEEFAASELQSYLFKISRAKLNIIYERNIKQNERYIFIGLGKRVKKFLLQHKIKELGKDGAVINLTGTQVILSGGRPRGSLNAVYTFLEDYIGCRWWTPTESYIPKKLNIFLPYINKIFIPPFEYRNHFVYNSTSNSEFAAKLRQNGDHQNLNDQYGSNEKILGFVHTFSKILPPEKYFIKYPEWYSDPSNKGQPCTSLSNQPESQKTQLCLTNKQMQTEFLKNSLDWIAKNPTYNIVSISQNDNNVYCRCKNCARIIKQEGSPSGLILRFVNIIAEKIEQHFPDKKIETLAYLYSLEPPTSSRPRKNVIIRIAPINANWGYAITSHKNMALKNKLLRWVKISKENYYWAYNTNFTNLLLPHPSLYHTGDDLKFLAENGFKGVFIQDNNYTNGFGYFLELQTWVIGHLMWNPKLNIDHLVTEFMTQYYGDGGNFLLRYLKLIDSSFIKQNRYLSSFNTDYSFITEDLLKTSSNLFEAALEAVKNNNIVYERILKAKTAFDFTWLYLHKNHKIKIYSNKKNSFNKIEYDNYVNSLFKEIDSYNVKSIDLEISKPEYHKKFIDSNPMKNFIDNKLKFEQHDFRLYKKGSITDILKDENASDNFIAGIYGGSKEWAIQQDLQSYSSILNNNNWQISAWVNVDLKTSVNGILKPGFISMGVYNVKKKTVIAKMNIPVVDLAKIEYTKISIPSIKLNGDEYIWFSILNDKYVSIFKVDKIEITKLER